MLMRSGLLLLLVVAPVARVQASDQFEPTAIEFFETRIRPLLVERCFKCHASEKEGVSKGGLRLDSRKAVLAGGDSGPAVIAGKPDQSLLIQAIRYEGDYEMPPKGKLKAADIESFVRWVELGLPWPSERIATAPDAGTLSASNSVSADQRRWWSYQLVQPVAIPAVPKSDWPRNDIDRFVLARLEAFHLKPAAPAVKSALVRRLYFDLIGLPPTPEEIEAFVSDAAPDSYERLVNRLLDSPSFGERWGRHWLDIARFAESLTLRGFVLKEAWRYRDYVIDSFNRDTPYNQFIIEQIAGDLLPGNSLDESRRQLVATTFLTLGNHNLEEQDKQQLRMDVVDEQLDVIGRGILAQTITCARCHNHKFDPIPTRDYYALAGILRNTRMLEHANVSKWLERPLPSNPDQEKLLDQHDGAVALIKEQIQSRKSQLAKLHVPRNPAKPAVVATEDLLGIVVDDSQAKRVGEWKASIHSGSYVGAGYIHDIDAGKGKKTLTFQPELTQAGKYEVRIAYSADNNRAAKVPVTVFSAEGEVTVFINQRKAPEIDGLFHSVGQYRFETNGQAFVIISNEGTEGHVIADAVVLIPVEKLSATSRSVAETDPVEQSLAKELTDSIETLEKQTRDLEKDAPQREMAMSVMEEPNIEDARVHIRGNVHTLGAVAPRGFLQVATPGSMAALPADQSGRKQLAEWLANAQNPLTARVMVNRTWHWLFGAGLVRTVDNFGTTGELPSHPELLDYLAGRFVVEGWSVKKLVRSLVLSQTYRQSIACESSVAAVDPENRLLSHMNRRRLEAECLRDAMLSVSGRLQLERGGPTFKSALAADFGFQYRDSRRSVYVPVFRNSLPELFEVFDFADPSITTGRRNSSTVATQALFLMNNPFVLEQSHHAAVRSLAESNLDDAGRVRRAYQRTFGRFPTEGEQAISEQFLASASEADREKAWTQFLQSLFASIDFRFLN